MPYEFLTKARLTAALRRLSDLATAEGIELDVAIYGGAVFTLVYGSREATKDVDAIIKPADVGARLVATVAAEQGLPEDWLNGEVRQFLSPFDQRRPFPTKEFEPGLRITIPTAKYLLALKLKAARPRVLGYAGDEPDIKFLLGKVRPENLEAVDEVFEGFFPGEIPHEFARAMVERLLSELKERPLEE
ncbi:MAG TPA: hypothetical protein VMM36_08120 [Opitutaceae bacterium]|nr:hypothetical protein [Opitutaceae bacterium]